MRETAGNLKRGTYITYKGSTWQVVKNNFSFQGRGLATAKLKLQDILTGKNVDVTFKSQQELDIAEINFSKMSYLYKDRNFLYFMDENYEQFSLPLNNIGNFINYIKEGEKYFILVENNSAINIKQPENVILLVTEAPDAVKGDTATTAKKLVKTQTGADVLVPLFIKKGDHISVDPETGEYLERKKI